MINKQHIKESIPFALTGIDIPGFTTKLQGKVRDIFIKNGMRILVTTDRQSAFDHILGNIPYKGSVLNKLSQFWFELTEHIVKNHMIAVPDPNVMVCHECQPIALEVVVRGYMTGVTKTSLWHHYEQGERTIYGINFPDGMNKNQQLPQPVITPTNHEAATQGHDRIMTKQEILDQKIVSPELYEKIEHTALKLFEFGSSFCRQKGLILVDTKYEFGLLDGELILIDEIHTPDSSRFWKLESYEERINNKQEPENFDKEFLRLWYASRGFTGEGTPPPITEELIIALAERYIQVFETITGNNFVSYSYPITDRIVNNIQRSVTDDVSRTINGQPRITYKEAGVDIETGNKASATAQRLAKETYRPEIEEINSIAGFVPRFADYSNPFLIGGADGVGTKLKIAFAANIHDTIGIDLVAMSVNDLIRRGAEPLIYIPYIGMQRIEDVKTEQINRGIITGCQQANCSIISGETAELSDFYQPNEYDVAGSSIGVVEKDAIIDGSRIVEGDIILGIPSRGLHSNGFTLARKVLLERYRIDDVIPELNNEPLYQEMLKPTRIYVRELLPLVKNKVEIHGMAHITGGGMPVKFSTIIPEGLCGEVNADNWVRHPIFNLIQKLGNVADKEMFYTFNMGIGMMIVCPATSVPVILKQIPDAREVGKIVRGISRLSITQGEKTIISC
ncbi:MAG: phosphoribosylaminoimidazolesuccinocarboxamide synthase [Patescibacteria group bacterium]